MNKSRRYAPNLCLNPEMKSIEPKIKQMIAENNRKGANIGDIF